MNENEALTVTLTLDNDEELECAVLTIFETAGQEYICLLYTSSRRMKRNSSHPIYMQA